MQIYHLLFNVILHIAVLNDAQNHLQMYCATSYALFKMYYKMTN